MISGRSPDGKFIEMVELPGHPWYLGCQFHPEYKSKPTEPHPLFVSYIAAALAESTSAPARRGPPRSKRGRACSRDAASDRARPRHRDRRHGAGRAFR